MDIKTILTPKRKLNWFNKLMLVINGLAVLATLLSYLAPVTDPLKSSFIALLGLGYMPLLLINIGFIAYWLLRSRPYMLISGLCLLVGFGILAKNFQISFTKTPGKKASASIIRMMNYNVHDFLTPLNKYSTHSQIAKVVLDKQPDILTIEEYTFNILDRKTTHAAMAAAMRSPNYYFKGYNNTSWDSSGMAIYTRYPIINKGSVSPNYDQGAIGTMFVDLRYTKTKVLRVYATHLQPIQFDAAEHEYLYNLRHRANINFREWRIIVNKLRAAFKTRSRQVALVKKHMDKCPYPIIVAGDLNDTPISYSVNEIGRGLKNAFREKGCGFGITYYGDFPHLQIDYIMAGRQFNILNYQVIKDRASDHYPIVSDMTLN